MTTETGTRQPPERRGDEGSGGGGGGDCRGRDGGAVGRGVDAFGVTSPRTSSRGGRSGAEGGTGVQIELIALLGQGSTRGSPRSY